MMVNDLYTSDRFDVNGGFECRDVYFAGLFDGEGSISVRRSKGSYSLRARISMVNKDVLLAFQYRFGGSLTMEPGQKAKTWRGGTQPQWTWYVTVPKEPFLRAIQPYLIEKRTQVTLGLQYIAEFGEGQDFGWGSRPERKARQQWYYEEFKRLKKVCEGCDNEEVA